MYVWRCSEEVGCFGCYVVFKKEKEADCNSEAVLTVERVQLAQTGPQTNTSSPLVSFPFFLFSVRKPPAAWSLPGTPSERWSDDRVFVRVLEKMKWFCHLQSFSRLRLQMCDVLCVVLVFLGCCLRSCTCAEERICSVSAAHRGG